MNWAFAAVCLLFVVILTLGIIAIYFIPQIISFLLEPGSGSMKSESEEGYDETSSEGVKSDTVRVKTDSHTAYNSRKSSREKENLFSRLNPFSGKKKCNECGAELEYKEEYQSYYCPECRTYK